MTMVKSGPTPRFDQRRARLTADLNPRFDPRGRASDNGRGGGGSPQRQRSAGSSSPPRREATGPDTVRLSLKAPARP